MGIHTEAIQKLYVAYFARPADFGGLQYWENYLTNLGGTVDAIAAQFAASDEYKATYAGKDAYNVVAAVYQNLFGRAPDVDGLNFWAQAMMRGDVTVDKAVTQIAAGAQGSDLAIYNAKVSAATAFTNALDTTAEILGYSGPVANAAAKTWMAGVTDGTLDASIAPGALDVSIGGIVAAGSQSQGKTYNLTANVDTITGTDSNDTFNAGYDPITGLHGLSGLDKIDGGAGVDVLNLTDASGAAKIDLTLLSGVTNVEKLNIAATGAVTGNNGGADAFKFGSGYTDVAVAIKQGADITMTAARTTSLNISNDAGVTVVGGGKTVTVVADGDVTIGNNGVATSADRNAFTSATVSGNVVNITDNSATGGAIGTTLTTVTLDSIVTSATITGNKVSTVNLSNSDTVAVSVNNSNAHALSLNADTFVSGTFTDSTATSVAITATGDDTDFDLVAAAAKSLSVGGDAVVILNGGSDFSALTKATYNGSGYFEADLSTAGKLTSVDASAAKGDLYVTIAGTNADSVAQSVTGGAGDDTVIITGTLGKGSTLNLGAGSDVVKVAGGEITGDAVVDAGAGTDILSLAIVGDANVGAFKNFEQFDVAGVSGSFDEAVLDQQNTVQSFIGTGALGGAATLDSLGSGVSFIVKGDMTGAALTLTQATAGALTITSDVDEAKADGGSSFSDASIIASNATSLNLVFNNDNADKIADVGDNEAHLTVTGMAAKTVSIVSGGTESVNYVDFTGNKTSAGADILTTVTITGDQALHLNYLTGGGSLQLATVDASGMTGGGLSFDMVDLKAGGIIKLGGGDDIIAGASPADSTAITTSTVKTISGMAKGSAEGVAAQDGFDVIAFAGAVQAADVTAAVGVNHSIKDGIYTFIGAGATNLGAAITQIAGQLDANEVVSFTFGGNKYIFAQGATTGHGDDLIVKVTGTTFAGVDVTDNGIYLF